jgi:hypothetical protein
MSRIAAAGILRLGFRWPALTVVLNPRGGRRAHHGGPAEPTGRHPSGSAGYLIARLVAII